MELHMTSPLLERQLSLLNYLTSAEAIFGDREPMHSDPSLHGIDRSLLHLEARFSHEKRMEKIAGIFWHTLKLLESDRELVERAFVEGCPPVSIGRLENARQFHDFLIDYWRREPHRLPYIADVAACEFALAQARDRGRREPGAGQRIGDNGEPSALPAVRRDPGVILLRCRYDIRFIFTSDGAQRTPQARDVALSVTARHDGREPDVAEIDLTVYDLLCALEAWTPLRLFQKRSAAQRLVAELVTRGLLETHG
jgi:hypothetical protein